MEVATFVDNKIKEKKVVMFSKSYCPFCTMAKEALKDYDYEVIEIENDPRCSEIQDYLLKITGARSVPRVFINGKCIGGGTETKAMAASGELAKLINA